MSTSYESIYNAFLGKIIDFDLPLMEDDELDGYCRELLGSALVKLKSFDHDLADRDEDTKVFNEDLSDLEKEVLSCQMVVEWVDRKINTTQLLHMYVGTKDESMASQANHIKALMELKDKQRSIVTTLMRDFKYQQWIEEEATE